MMCNMCGSIMATSATGITEFAECVINGGPLVNSDMTTTSDSSDQSETTSTTDNDRRDGHTSPAVVNVSTCDVTDGVISRPDISSVTGLAVTCDDHDGADLIYVCEDCFDTRPVVCSECVVSLHKGHKLDLLTTVAARKRQKMLTFIENANAQYSAENSIASVDNQIRQHDECTQGVVYQIRKSSDDLKREIETDVGEKLSMCHSVGKQNSETLKLYRLHKLSRDNNIKAHLEECKRVIRESNDVEVFVSAEGTSPPETVAVPTLSTQTFRKCVNTQCTIEEMCGQLVTEEIQGGEYVVTADMQENHVMKKCESSASSLDRSSNELPLSQNHKSQTAKKGLLICPEVPHTICATSSGSIWIGSADHMSIIRLNRKGEVLSILNCFVEITAMSFSNVTDNVWISGKDNSIREVVCPEPVLVRFFVESTATAICATGDSRVLVGMPFVVQAYTTQGTPLHRTRTSGLFISPLAIAPVQIAECPVTHNLAVISRKRQNARSTEGTYTWVVLGLDAKLKPRFQHEIRDRQNPDQKFEPVDLCYNHSFLLVLTKCKKLYGISPSDNEGRFIETFPVPPISISRVTNSLSVIGFQNKEVKFYKYKNHSDFF